MTNTTNITNITNITNTDVNVSTDYQLNKFTITQFGGAALSELANNWINLLDVQYIGEPNVLAITVEFVTPLSDGRTRWMKTIIAVDKDDYFYHEEKVIKLLIATVNKAREQIKATQRG